MSNIVEFPNVLPASDIDLRLNAVGAQLAWARALLAETTEAAKAAAREAADAGVSECQIAAALGVARSRTLRRWLGKG